MKNYLLTWVENQVRKSTGAQEVCYSNGAFHCLMSVDECGPEGFSIPWHEAIANTVIDAVRHWFKEPEVYAPNYVVETTYSNVFSTLTQEESVMALREYGRLCNENKWLSHIEPEVMHSHLFLVNAHLTSKRKAEATLHSICDKYNFQWDLFIDIIDEEYMTLCEK